MRRLPLSRTHDAEPTTANHCLVAVLHRRQTKSIQKVGAGNTVLVEHGDGRGMNAVHGRHGSLWYAVHEECGGSIQRMEMEDAEC